MSLPKIYDPSLVEEKWYAYWIENKFFQSKPDQREPFTIVMPPPNVTGILHMGHMLNNTIQDVLIRRARMLGKNACWVPGTDHASIATEAKVVGLLKELGKSKKEIGRDKFMEYAFEWKEKYGGIILEQLKKIGASCDWDRTRFTMEKDLSDAVIEQFIRLYKKGLIYRGARMVNWDPTGKTAVSDEEVIYKSVQSQLHYLKYSLVDSEEFILVATTRPETILADVAVCVHPEDPRYHDFHGKLVKIPLTDREIPIITDSLVSMDFGTGCLKITPAHSLMDYEIGTRFGLPIIDILEEDGRLNEKGGKYAGLDRFEARKKIVIDLGKEGFLEKSENYTSQVGFSERTDAVIEPRISTQWFLKMDQLGGPALKAFISEEKPEIQLIPDKYLNTYRHWMESIHDWCISRQLWWGQRIPAWYNENGDFVVAKLESEAREEFLKNGYSQESIHQDEDVLDTWFSSWLWPITVFDGVKDPQNLDFKYYYPTHDLVTAPEILFFWVARMVMIGLDLTGQVPFRKVYLTGIVRDKQGRKMSKSLGNSPDPLDLIHQYGADAIRMGLLLSSPAGNDLLYDEGQVQQGRNFANKIWNALRLMETWKSKLISSSDSLIPAHEKIAMDWFSQELRKFHEKTPKLFDEYRLSEFLMELYRLTWDGFCGWYLEMIKPSDSHSLHRKTFNQTLDFFKVILMNLHPVMPFITEELWGFIHLELEIDPQDFRERGKIGQSIMFARIDHWENYLPKIQGNNQELNSAKITEEWIKPAITEIRNIRNSYQISFKEGLKLGYRSAHDLADYFSLFQKLAGIHEFEWLKEKPENTSPFKIGEVEFYLFIENKLDKEQEIQKIREEIGYTQGFLASVEAKLNNEKFMAHAKPAVKELELKKKSDAEEKLRSLGESLKSLENQPAS